MNIESKILNFFRTPFFLPWFYPKLTWRVETASKELYLTFDDGPIPGPTEFVLETLKKYNAKATFFSIGDNIQKHQDLFRRIGDEGHAVGNHTFNHLSGWKTPANDYLRNVELCQSLIPVSNTRKLFRPPYGRITRTQIRSLSAYKIIMWDVLTHDYAKNLSRHSCLNGSVAAARPGSIVVFHDSIKAEKNMQFTLPQFLGHFANLGYEFKSLQ